MAGAGRLLGGGAQVRRARRVDRMEPAGAVRAAAPDRQQRAAAPSRTPAEPRLAVPGALRPAHRRRLAGAPSSSAAAAGDVLRSDALPRDGLPRRELDARRRDPGIPPPPRRIRRRIDPEAGPASAARPQRTEPAPRAPAGGGAPTAWSREDEEDERGRGGRNPGLLQGRRGRPPRGRRAPPPHRVPAGALHRRHALRGDGMEVDPRMDPEPQPGDAGPLQVPQDRRRAPAAEHLLHPQHHDQGRPRPACPGHGPLLPRAWLGPGRGHRRRRQDDLRRGRRRGAPDARARGQHPWRLRPAGSKKRF